MADDGDDSGRLALALAPAAAVKALGKRQSPRENGQKELCNEHSGAHHGKDSTPLRALHSAVLVAASACVFSPRSHTILSALSLAFPFCQVPCQLCRLSRGRRHRRRGRRRRLCRIRACSVLTCRYLAVSDRKEPHWYNDLETAPGRGGRTQCQAAASQPASASGLPASLGLSPAKSLTGGFG
jgi:hypothetical protein